MDRLFQSMPDRDGFTLVEILVVLAILTIGILPLAMVQTQARHEVSKSDRFTQAITLAQSQLEQMKGAGFGNAVPDSGQVGAIQWRTAVQNVSFGLDRLEVAVSWFDGVRDQTMVVSDLVSTR
jgi:prepilin-type N-terminal cleavage/methylation domain-containing protein